MEPPQYIEGRSGKIAYHFIHGDPSQPPIVFIHGYKSDMNGGKALFLESYCKDNNRAFVRFDCYGHGQSDGDMNRFKMSKAFDDCLTIAQDVLDGQPALYIGSSMGGWLALLMAHHHPEKVAGMIGIAAAPDFTRNILSKMTDAQRDTLAKNGYISEPSGYEEPYIFTQDLFDDGERHCLLDETIHFDGPVHLLQGKQDDAVDWHMPEKINAALSGNADITLIDDGDHSLSRPQDLDLLKSSIEQMFS